MRIGIVGSGMIGATLGELWVKAGHEVLLSARRLEALAPLVARLGERARAGTPDEAAAFGEAILLAVPFGATAALGARLAAALAGGGGSAWRRDPDLRYPQVQGDAGGIVRAGARAAVGADEATWKALVEAARPG